MPYNSARPEAPRSMIVAPTNRRNMPAINSAIVMVNPLSRCESFRDE
jgi:hypothetical protein